MNSNLKNLKKQIAEGRVLKEDRAFIIAYLSDVLGKTFTSLAYIDPDAAFSALKQMNKQYTKGTCETLKQEYNKKINKLMEL